LKSGIFKQTSSIRGRLETQYNLIWYRLLSTHKDDGSLCLQMKNCFLLGSSEATKVLEKVPKKDSDILIWFTPAMKNANKRTRINGVEHTTLRKYQSKEMLLELQQEKAVKL